MAKRNVEWYVLPDHQGHEVNELGEIRNRQTGRTMQSSVNQSGVRYVSIRNTTLGRYENKTLGVLIAETFCGGRTANESTVLHLDGNTENNAAQNLMWATRWHTMAFHNEIVDSRFNKTPRVQEITTGHIYKNALDAAKHTGCLPSAIDYALRYNQSVNEYSNLNFVHKTYPGGLIFKYA